MRKKLIGRKIFLQADQDIFIENSLDYNPAHVTNNKLNQFKLKKPIVHGINILLTSLEMCLSKKKIKLNYINCNFIKPIHLNEKVKFYYYENNKNEFSIEVESKDEISAKIMISKPPKKIVKLRLSSLRVIKKTKKISKTNPIKFLNKTFKINFAKKIKFNQYPLVKKYYSEIFCDAMFTASFFIGMICPGKNAIFSNLSLNLNKLEKNKKYLIFKVNKFDTRIDLFEINTKGFIEISLKSFFKKIK